MSLERFWNYVFVPYLVLVLGFGIYLLFTVNSAAFSTTTGTIVKAVGALPVRATT